MVTLFAGVQAYYSNVNVSCKEGASVLFSSVYQILILPTDAIQPTLTLKMSAVIERSINVKTTVLFSTMITWMIMLNLLTK